MSKALLITAAVLLPVLVGVITGAIVNPRKPWKDTLLVAAFGAGGIGGLLVVAIFVGMIIHPTECTHANCHDTDTGAAVGVVFVGVLLAPIYALVLPGAALGKLLGRGFLRLIRH
jgi:hypothetical protein